MSHEYSKKLHSLIPGGAHTYSKGDDQFPSNAPCILDYGKGAYVYDLDGNRFLDYGMGLRSVTLGYAHERVNRAAIRAIEKGNNLTRPSIIELEAAEKLIDLFPSAEMVKFAKNGSNVTTAAVKIARAATGRDYIAVPKEHPFFSFDDWFISTTLVQKGIPNKPRYTLNFRYGHLESLQELFKLYPGQIAGVIMEPVTSLSPCPQICSLSQSGCIDCPNKEGNFLQQVQRLCKDNGALFILDEMITGFRWHLQGAQTYFDVIPDLTTVGKAMANGFPLAALLGKREFMDLGGIHNVGEERTFLLSSTHGSEMSSLNAFLETLEIYKEMDVIEHLWGYASSLVEGFNAISQEKGLSDYFSMSTLGPIINYSTKDLNNNLSLDFRTLFNQEMVKNNVLLPWVSPSYSHGHHEIQLTLEAASHALDVYSKALDAGVQKYLSGPSIKPVFRKYN